MARNHGSISAFLLAVIAAFSITLVTACENTARGLQDDARDVEAATRDERAEAAAAARELGDEAAHTARTLGQAAAEAGEELAERAGAAIESVDVKAALMADAAVDATRIDVHVDHRTRTVTLGGFVPTPAERAAAEAIAKAEAERYKVVNNIAVQPRG